MRRRKQSSEIHLFFLLSLISGLAWVSCTKPTINFGTTFVNNNNTNIVVVDSISTLISTVSNDSFNTTQSGALLTGRYRDDAFGLVTARTYFQIAPPLNIPTITNLAGFDSLVLIARLNKSFYGDTSVTQRFVVKQLLTPIQYPGIQFNFFNNDTIPCNNNPLGYANVIVHPTAGYTSQLAYDSLKLRLPDNNGLALFRMIQNRSDTITNTNSFLGYFKGLSIQPADNSQGAIFGFSDTVVMRLFYHEPGVVITPHFTDFVLWNRALQFNQITYDRTGTPLEALHSAKPSNPGVPVEIPTELTGHQGYVQGGTALRMKIRFPYLWKLQQLPDFISILKADLTLIPVTGTYSPILAVPPQLEIFQTDERNLLLSPVTLSGAQFGNLIVDYVYGANSNYTYDVTNYMRTQATLGADLNQRNGIMVVVPSPDDTKTFNRVIFGDSQFPNLNYRIKLKIYYASFY